MNQLPNWLLRVSLLLALSSFCGYTGKPVIDCRQPVQTSWQYTPQQSTPRNAVAYKETDITFYEVNNHNNRNRHKVALLFYNRAEEVKLHICSAFIAREIIHWFLQQKINPEIQHLAFPLLQQHSTLPARLLASIKNFIINADSLW